MVGNRCEKKKIIFFFGYLSLAFNGLIQMYNAYTFINAPTHPMRPDTAFNLIKDLGDFKNLTLNQDSPLIYESTLRQEIYFKNANIT